FTVSNTDVPAGPPRDLLNLALVCRTAHKILSLNSAPLYADVFAQLFDIRGPIFRLGESTVRDNAKLELQRRFIALNIFRQGDLDHPHLTDAFWIAYMMFEDADVGQENIKRLLGSDLLVFLNKFLLTRLYRGSETNNGWPIPNEQNSLAYPIFSTAESRFDIASFTHQATSSSTHGPYPPPPLLPRDVLYFGKVHRTMRVPSVSLFSALSFFTRQELLCLQIPPHMQTERPINDAQGAPEGPTCGDIQDFADHCRTNFAHFPGFDVGVLRPSRSSTQAEAMPYKLGTLSGKWRGSYIANYESWLGTLAAPPEFPTTGRFPLYLSLEEHFILEPSAMVPPVDASTGTTNAWLPDGFSWTPKKVSCLTEMKTLENLLF
ncbi:hypothetical protein DXG03_009359, partial [Asterophora parasitica]